MISMLSRWGDQRQVSSCFPLALIRLLAWGREPGCDDGDDCGDDDGDDDDDDDDDSLYLMIKCVL